ncbi:cell division protein FtsY, chloroplastic-like [Dorcoceras hygrometricum]|uniref:Cell division protein FtsY, chloroplastic-like n=1 Tax=Dorcoceras hygrometricum TaxID=472368 RepID=A0A2Z7C6N3_9LAMI|nr:cell division protein FtsY, chloroplastic-like [Dorcoceras hygrometricum]
MHMLCKGSRPQPKTGSQRIATTRSDQRNNQFVATGILSTWELPTHLQYTIPDANNQLHPLLLTHEMWELPTPLIAANKSNRENEVRELPAQPPRYTGTTRSSLNIASWYSQFNRTCIASKTGLDSNMRELNLPQKARSEIRRLCPQSTQGRCLSTPHKLQENVQDPRYTKRPSKRSPALPLLLQFRAIYRRKSKRIRRVTSLTCAWLQPVFQEPGASRLIAVVTSIRSTTRFETPSSDCTRSPDEISTIGFSSKSWPETNFRRSSGGGRRTAAARKKRVGGGA